SFHHDGGGGRTASPRIIGIAATDLAKAIALIKPDRSAIVLGNLKKHLFRAQSGEAAEMMLHQRGGKAGLAGGRRYNDREDLGFADDEAGQDKARRRTAPSWASDMADHQ